jgi:hypothetical protein
VGSSRTGSFGDYQPGVPSIDKCQTSVHDEIEEVALSEFWVRTAAVPPAGAGVRLRPEPEDGRLVVESSDGDQAVGLFPTKYSYLALCMARGFRYEGAVTASSSRPIPMVRVSLSPKE